MRSVHGPPPSRPSSASTHASSCSGTNGSRSPRLSCTGPEAVPASPVAAANARQVRARQYAFCPARRSGAPTSANIRTA